MFNFIHRTYLWIALLPWLLIGLGAACNQAVTMANHGCFPVLINSHYQQKVDSEGFFPDDHKHVVMNGNTRLKFLGDIFIFGDYEDVISIGDLLIDAGDASRGPLFWIWAGILFSSLQRGKEPAN